MSKQVTRRKMLGMTAGAAATALTGSNWVFALDGDGNIVRAASEDGVSKWSPKVLSRKEAEQLAAVCEAIIPRTDTPGARDARVHEYLDLELSIQPKERRKRFLDGLEWLNRLCKERTGEPLHKASDEEVISVLEVVSDDKAPHPEELRRGASFFSDVKGRTIFGYYSSKEGWADELGRPERIGMETFKGCTHTPGAHG